MDSTYEVAACSPSHVGAWKGLWEPAEMLSTSGAVARMRGVGEGWREVAAAARTPATASYVAVLEAAEPVSLVAAAFILYGALVVGGGKATQAKVRRVLPGCAHLS